MNLVTVGRILPFAQILKKKTASRVKRNKAIFCDGFLRFKERVSKATFYHSLKTKTHLFDFKLHLL